MARDLRRAQRFFEGQFIEFEAVRGADLSVRLFMQNAKGGGTNHSVDYNYCGGIKVSWQSGQLESNVGFDSSSYTFQGSGSLGSLFDNLTGKASYLSEGLIMGGTSGVPDNDTLAGCLFEIREQAKAEFLQENLHDGSLVRRDLWEKYFEPFMQETSDD